MSDNQVVEQRVDAQIYNNDNAESFYTWLMRTYAKGDAVIETSPSIPHEPSGDLGVEKLNQYITNIGGNEYLYTHYERFKNTINVFWEFISGASRHSIYELGGVSIMGGFASDILLKDVSVYSEDLRRPFEIECEVADCVLCLEVLEHIKDSPDGERTIEDLATFKYTGVMNLLKETFRILKDDGVLLITTPNACSLDTIVKIARGEPPYLFDPHVREMTPRQVISFAAAAGFELLRFGTFYAWTTATSDERQMALEFVQSVGGDPRHRGDDAFFVFRKC